MIFNMIISFRIEITHKTRRCFPLWWVLQWRAWNWLWRHSRVWQVSKERYWWLWLWWCSYLLDELPHEELEDDPVFGTSGNLEGAPINHKFEEAIGGDEEELFYQSMSLSWHIEKIVDKFRRQAVGWRKAMTLRLLIALHACLPSYPWRKGCKMFKFMWYWFPKKSVNPTHSPGGTKRRQELFWKAWRSFTYGTYSNKSWVLCEVEKSRSCG